MTTHTTATPSPSRQLDPIEQHRHAAIEALTNAVTGAPHEPVDFAGFLAGVLAAVDANVGSTDRLLAGRPGSWEADLVRQLVAGTVGHDDEHLLEHRTREVVVPLNVPDLAWQRPGFPDVDEALDEIYARFAAIPDEEHDHDAEREAKDAVLTAYADAYRTYADAFTTAVTHASTRIEGLAVPVRVDAVHDPRPIYQPTRTATPVTARGDAAGQPGVGRDAGEYGRVRNPDEFDDPAAADPLVLAVWEAAYRAVPAPTVTLPPSTLESAASAGVPAVSVEPASGEGQ